VNFGIVRGLDYYSGIVFEAFDKNSDIGALVGGGRYDTLTNAFGRGDLGATGVAGGVERIIHSLERYSIKTQSNNDRVWIVYVNDDMKKIATKIAATLRLKGIAAEVDLLGKPLRKQMEIASNSKCVVIVAPKEFATNSVIIRNMKDGSERQVKLEAILNEPKSSLQL
jgi:histidyl-tRNA synthetase